jgi:hypothetical protein
MISVLSVFILIIIPLHHIYTYTVLQDKVYSLSIDACLDENCMADIIAAGYSRVLVYSGTDTRNVRGYLQVLHCSARYSYTKLVTVCLWPPVLMAMRMQSGLYTIEKQLCTDAHAVVETYYSAAVAISLQTNLLLLLTVLSLLWLYCCRSRS